jgi:hypothetical protein
MNNQFNLKGSVDQEFSFIVKIYKKSFFVRNFDKIYIFWFSWITRLKQDAIRYIWYSLETENIEFYDATKKNMIWWQPLTAWTDWFVTSNGESFKRVVWHLVKSKMMRYLKNLAFDCLSFTWRFNYLIDHYRQIGS